MSNVREIQISKIQPSKLNPRKHYNEEKLKELAESIKTKGLINPILVRPLKNGDNFEIVCGERRYRASKLSKLTTISALVTELNDEEVLELQVIENLQRDDLNPIEEAKGFKALLEQCKYTQDKLAIKISKSQGYIASRLALLNLNEDFQKDIESERLLPGHVKYLMVIADRPKIMKAIRKEMDTHKEQLTIREFISVVGTVLGRQTKQLVKNSWSGPEFNIKDCKECEFRRSISSHYGPAEKKCVNADCYNNKQRLFRKAQKERIGQKIAKGAIVDEKILKNSNRLDDYRCNFDKKTCDKCLDKKVAIIKDRYSTASEKVEVCTNKNCFERKNKEAKEEREKNKEIAYNKKINKIKTKAAKTKMDKGFWIDILTENLIDCYDTEEAAVIKAYNIPEKSLATRKAIKEYFTRNNELDLEEIFRFITYWQD